MANLNVKDAAAASKYLKASGAGTDVDPHIPEHKETSAGSIKTAVEIMDDWDESDRAKVNPIAGQAGVAAGAGAVDALTQRTTLASDDPAVAHLATAVASLSVLDDWDSTDRAKVALPGTVVTVSPTLTTDPYEANDLLGGKLTLASAVRVAGVGGVIESITILDYDKQGDELDVVFFEADPAATTFTDAAAFDIHDTDLANVIGVVNIPASAYADFADNAVACVKGINLRFLLDSGTSLYAALVTRGTPTYAATGLTMKVGIKQD